MFFFFFHFYSTFKRNFCKQNSGEPDQMPRFVASDLVLHCLPMSHKKDSRLIWVKTDYHLMQVKSIAECSLGAFCNTFDLH